ncbi:hypothetical protein C2S52_022051 [Perilla frutescens var. hirtella]|nr:hypothetical protein C2S52_022051 [Perilla frutescens var. hirtella]
MSTAATPPASTAIPTSSQSSQESTSIHTSSNTKSTPQIPYHAHQTQSLTSKQAIAAPNLEFLKSDFGRVAGNRYEESGNRSDLDNSGVQHSGPEKITNLEVISVVGGGDGSKNAVNLSCQTGERPQSVAGTGSGKRKIVKKTVIVKKVIKKRVPKRRLVDALGNRGDVLKVEDGVNSSEVRNNGNLANDVIEKSNVVEVIEKTGINEAKDTVNTVDDFTEKLNIVNDVDGVKEETSAIHEVVEKADIRAEVPQNLEIVIAPNVSGPVVGEEVDDLSAEMEPEMSKPDIHAKFSEQMLPRNDRSGFNYMDADGLKGNDSVCEVERKDLTNPFCDLIEVKKVNLTPETIMETNERENTMTENQLEDCLMENQRIDFVNKADMELLASQNVDSIGEEIEVLGGQENGRPIAKAESCSGEVGSDCIKLTEGLLFSGEMEALERKKKRKTEIFIGGLDKYTKEEDIRAVFEDIGLVLEVRLVTNPKSGKNRGYAFVRFATAADAKNALAKYSRVEICGKHCNAAPVEGNDTIYLGNIDRKWKTDDVMKLLEKAGIDKIDKVTLKADPNNIERNRGFAFVEFQTNKDAQTAFKKLQKKDAFGKNQMVKVAWAQPLTEPAEEEILQVKSVYAEYLPSSWDEEKVKEYFKRFGELESVVLAKDLSLSRRKDFAFINYTTRDAALTCIDAVNRERLEDDCSKVKMAASLAKPIPKRKQTSNPTIKQHLEAKENAIQTSKKLHGSRNKGKAASSSYDYVKVDNRLSTTDELVQLLRQQASTKHNPPHLESGAIMPDHHFLLPGTKRTFSQVGHDPLYVERPGLSRVRVESSYQISGPSSLSHGVDLLRSPYHHQPGPVFPSESVNGRRIYSSHFQTRDQASYYGDTYPYHRRGHLLLWHLSGD